ncbi:MAG: T9SS type A sorting domain-containing protein [Ignavibacteria bacterium]|nr:T9SS type A sorting domain-containing protein [Ignavibacteria bacterium]
MKTRCPHFFRNAAAFFVLLLALTANLYTQPQYYNYNTAGTANSFPWNIPGGKQIQVLFLPGDFNQPTPAPNGNITSVSFRLAANLGPYTYTNVVIKMGQAAGLTTFAASQWYTGTMTEVYNRPSVQLGGLANEWLTITLDTPFPYDNTQSLIIDVQQCAAAGATGFSSGTTTLAGFRRNTSLTTSACPFVWGQQSGSMPHMGVNISSGPVNCSYSWANQTSGTTSLLYSVKTVSNLIGWAAGAAGTVRRTTDGGSTWTDANPNTGVITGDIYNIEALDANTAWVTTSPGATFIYKTTNGGTNWVQVYTVAGGFINAIKMVSATNGYAFGDPLAGNWLLLQTTDGGNNWTSLATIAGTGDGRNNCVQVSLPNMWFGSGQGTIWKSTNSGLNWTSVATTGLTGQVLGVRFNSATVGLGGGATMVKSTDGGTTYTLLPASGTGNITGIQGSGNDFWYTRGTGIFRSTDNGATWTQSHTHTAAQNDISLVQDGSGCMTGWSCGASGTIAKMTGVPVAVNEPTTQIPTEFKMEQNYPNPFNPTTNITFALPKSGVVVLKVYDVLGKEVASLVNSFTNAGTHIVPFDASALSSGVYIYKITTGEFTDSKKMVLIK